MLGYLLISGDSLYVGATLVLLGIATTAWRTTIGAVLTWCGLILALISAVPIHPVAYVALLGAGVAWQLAAAQNSQLKPRMAAALAIVAVAVSGMALAGRPRLEMSLPRDKPVCVIGDSISAGIGATKEGSWPQLLAATHNLNVLNLAHAGATLSTGSSQALLISEQPATVVVELGGNDLLGDTSPERFSSDLRSLLSAVTAKDRRVVMFELPLLPFQNRYGRIQREVCREYGVDLFPRHLLAGAIAFPGNAIDGLHLSARGNAWLAERVGRAWRAA